MSMKPTTLEVGSIIKLVLLCNNWMMILAQIGLKNNKKRRLLVSKLQNGKYNKIQQINLETLLRLRAL